MRGFMLSRGDRVVSLPMTAQRVVAFLALRTRPTMRTYVAEMLWLDSSHERAAANLRSALWRIRRTGCAIVLGDGDFLSLSPAVFIDVLELVDWSRRLLAGEATASDPRVEDALAVGDLLPEWYDDWVLVERERLRQLRLHALEHACAELAEAGAFGRAIEAGLAALAVEPFHESGHAALISAHLREGNRAEAIRQYEAYARLMEQELHLPPSPGVKALIAGLLA